MKDQKIDSDDISENKKDGELVSKEDKETDDGAGKEDETAERKGMNIKMKEVIQQKVKRRMTEKKRRK